MILVESLKQKSRFWTKILKIAILVKLYEISILVKNFWKSRFYSNFLKIGTSLKIFKHLHFGKEKKSLTSHLVKIPENPDFGRKKFENSWFCWKFSQILLMVQIKNSRNLGQNFRKIFILVIILKKFSIFVKKFRKCRLCYKYCNIFILVNIFENIDIVQYLRKITMFIEIYHSIHIKEKCRF